MEERRERRPLSKSELVPIDQAIVNNLASSEGMLSPQDLLSKLNQDKKFSFTLTSLRDRLSYLREKGWANRGETWGLSQTARDIVQQEKTEPKPGQVSPPASPESRREEPSKPVQRPSIPQVRPVPRPPTEPIRTEPAKNPPLARPVERAETKKKEKLKKIDLEELSKDPGKLKEVLDQFPKRD